MVLSEPLEFARDFINKLNQGIDSAKPGAKLSRCQSYWLAFCISAIIIANTVCWAEFERISLGKYTLAALSWMFRVSKISWDQLLIKSVQVLLKTYEIKEGTLVLDDSDRLRSKNTEKIAQVHKMKDKKTGGYVMGQNLIFLLFVSSKISFPVGFAFYEPDPALRTWKKEDLRLKKEGIKKKERPPQPERGLAYPTKQDLALKLLQQFSQDFPDVTVKCILADALYGNAGFMTPASKIFNGVQVISQLKRDQLIRIRKRNYRLQDYFRWYQKTPSNLSIRSGETQAVLMGGARLYVKAHGVKRFVISLRYENETEDRYIVATDLTWRMTDIAYAYTMRWLVEVFFSDWKLYEGWCNMAKQPGVEGSYRGVILSLLTDHALLTHQDQAALLKHKLPACTVGSLRDKIRFDALVQFMREMLEAEDPQAALTACLEQIKRVIVLSPSNKHLNHREIGCLESSPSLKYKKAA